MKWTHTKTQFEQVYEARDAVRIFKIHGNGRDGFTLHTAAHTAGYGVSPYWRRSTMGTLATCKAVAAKLEVNDISRAAGTYSLKVKAL